MSLVPVVEAKASESASYSAWDTFMERNVPFDSLSDALIASLRLTHSLSANTVNIILDIIHNPGFASRDVSFKSVVDIESHLAEQNKNLTERRSMAAFEPQSFPAIILELVLDVISTELFICRDGQRKTPGFDFDSVRSLYTLSTTTLCRLSLVCRSWTSACQRRLARIVQLTSRRFANSSEPQFFHPLRHPFVRSMCQHLSIVENKNRNSLRSARHTTPIPCMFIASLPNLRSLSIRSNAATVPQVTELVGMIGRLKHLEYLQWDVSDGIGLPRLFAALNGLPYLRTVCLQGGITHRDPTAQEILESLPRRTFPLDDLILERYRGLHHDPCVKWLLGPSSSSIVTKLSLSRNPSITSDILSSWGGWSSLETLEISMYLESWEFLSQCSSLRTFTLYASHDIGRLLPHLPSTLHALTLFVSKSALGPWPVGPPWGLGAWEAADPSEVEMDRWTTANSTLSAALRDGSLPQLEDLIFWQDLTPSWEDWMPEGLTEAHAGRSASEPQSPLLWLTETQDVCSERGIRLTISAPS